MGEPNGTSKWKLTACGFTAEPLRLRKSHAKIRKTDSQEKASGLAMAEQG